MKRALLFLSFIILAVAVAVGAHYLILYLSEILTIEGLY